MAIITLVVAAPAPPQQYEQAVGLVLERRSLVPRELSVDVCPAGPPACMLRGALSACSRVSLAKNLQEFSNKHKSSESNQGGKDMT